MGLLTNVELNQNKLNTCTNTLLEKKRILLQVQEETIHYEHVHKSIVLQSTHARTASHALQEKLNTLQEEQFALQETMLTTQEALTTMTLDTKSLQEKKNRLFNKINELEKEKRIKTNQCNEIEITLEERTMKLKNLTTRGDMFSAVESLEKETQELQKMKEMYVSNNQILIQENEKLMGECQSKNEKQIQNHKDISETIIQLKVQEQQLTLNVTQGNQTLTELNTLTKRKEQEMKEMQQESLLYIEDRNRCEEEMIVLDLEKSNITNDLLRIRSEHNALKVSLNKRNTNMTMELSNWEIDVIEMQNKLQESQSLFATVEYERKEKEIHLENLKKELLRQNQKKMSLTIENARLMESNMFVSLQKQKKKKKKKTFHKKEEKKEEKTTQQESKNNSLRWTNDGPSMSEKSNIESILSDMSALTN